MKTEEYGKSGFFSVVEVSQVAQIACMLEVSTVKPGNVTPVHNFDDMFYSDFLLSASAIGPAIGRINELDIGEAILESVRETRKFVSVNTNLGIILLLVPLAKSYNRLAARSETALIGERDKLMGLRRELRLLLTGLSVKDAVSAYEAIRMAESGALGKVENEDIQQTPQVSLREAMELSQNRDGIAREYVTDFEVVFTIGYPTMKDSFSRNSLFEAIQQTFITVLAHVPDTLIERKAGVEKAEEVMLKARNVLSLGGVSTKEGRKKIALLDRELKREGNRFNPGTTADITTAAIFTFILISGMDFFHFYNQARQSGVTS
jgi:triphosphoribosyl-dephospho-CoA synthase